MLRRFSVFSLVFLLCLSLFPSPALAFDVGVDLMPNGSYWGGMTDSDNYGSFVRANNKFDAAVYSLGLSVPETIPVEVRSKLSDPNYGGRFYEYAQTFYNVQGWPNMPEWLPAYAMGFVGLGASFDRIYASNASVNLRTDAEIDFRVIVGGGDVVGGGGSSSAGGYIELFANANAASSSNPSDYRYFTYTVAGATFNDGSVVTDGSSFTYSAFPQSSSYLPFSRVYLSSSSIDFINSYVSQGYDAIVFSGGQVGVLFGHDLQKIYYDASSEPIKMFRVFGSDGLIARVLGDNTNFKDSDGVFAVMPSFSSSDVRSISFGSKGIGLPYLSDVISSPLAAPSVPPDGDWPEVQPTPTPTAPDLPEPAEPVVQTPVTPTVPAPVWPDITINIDNDPTPGTTPSGLDYTELLTRMNDNLISIDSFARAINSNLNSLRSDLLAEFNGVYDSLRNIYSYLLTIDTVLETHCVHLRNKIEESAVFIANYMRTLIKWLADQLDYDDLTNVEAPDNSLLTTINDKLGGGTYEPNPIKDEQGYYEWLDDLWDRFLLGDNWQSSMGNISGSFSELKTRFPFSVPWDIVALFRLFVHDPVTPVFDLPLYFSADGSTPVHVDLSPWDSVASLVRPMVFVIFALKLALLSRDLLGGLGADKGGL